MLYKFRKLEGQGIRPTMNYNMNSNLEDMRTEYYKLKKQRETENSVKFQRKILMAAVTGAEFMNNKFERLYLLDFARAIAATCVVLLHYQHFYSSDYNQQLNFVKNLQHLRH